MARTRGIVPAPGQARWINPTAGSSASARKIAAATHCSVVLVCRRAIASSRPTAIQNSATSTILATARAWIWSARIGGDARARGGRSRGPLLGMCGGREVAKLRDAVQNRLPTRIALAALISVCLGGAALGPAGASAIELSAPQVETGVLFVRADESV